MKLKEQEGVRSVGLMLIGWSVLLSNILLLAFQYYLPLVHQKVLFPNVVSFISMTAVFPRDFYFTYLDEIWYAHFGWIFTMIICSLGILRVNKMSRMIFIVLNVVHGVILANIVLLRFGQPVFLQYFFKLYFNLVAILTYVGFITTGEMRILFGVDEAEGYLNNIFQRAHIKTPVLTDAKGYYNLALAYGRLERYEDAVATLKKAIRISPEDPKLYFQLGIIYLKRDEYAGAINSFKETIHLDPIFSEVYYYVGIAYRQQGCDKEAIPYLERASRINQKDKKVLYLLGECCIAAHLNHKAIDVFHKAMHLDPHNERIFYYLGTIYCEMEQYETARQTFRNATRLEPSFSEAHFQMGMVCIKLSRFKEAIRAFKDALHRDLSNTRAHYQLGFAYAMIEDFDSAHREHEFLKSNDEDLAQTLGMIIK